MKSEMSGLECDWRVMTSIKHMDTPTGKRALIRQHNPKLSSISSTDGVDGPLGVSSSMRLSVGKMSTNSAISIGRITSVMLEGKSCSSLTAYPTSNCTTAPGSSPDSIKALAHPNSDGSRPVKSTVDWAVMSTGYPPFATPSSNSVASSGTTMIPEGAETSADTTTWRRVSSHHQAERHRADPLLGPNTLQTVHNPAGVPPHHIQTLNAWRLPQSLLGQMRVQLQLHPGLAVLGKEVAFVGPEVNW
ncbi:hypothetical protein EYF80_031293 [Liparis tanakae]|uniref:Uncharacterized protein n=1 Tax=Liparis tanakae TaxID=230148 RepID=A0A4Z2GZ12_9TELE|nr:hypothetical protein EYF80_031293 [Liparis tanakae]